MINDNNGILETSIHLKVVCDNKRKQNERHLITAVRV